MAESLNAGRTKKTAAAAAGCEDRFEDLPVHVLELLLSFLPSKDAVRTCVLAKRWRHIWKSVTSLRIYHDEFDTAEELNYFVTSMMEVRDPTVPLHVCEITPYVDSREVDLESLVQYAVSCQVQLLRVQIMPGYWNHDCLSNNSVISQHLTRLELDHVQFELNHSLELWRCEALEVLDLMECEINLGDISFAKSFRHLRIRYSGLHPENIRTRISAPGLVTCELSDYLNLTPLFGSLPSLISAFIRITDGPDMYCDASKDRGHDLCQQCCCKDDCSVLLEGLSGATNLELICHSSIVIFSKDLKWRPMFGKLKTVLLNDWCVTHNFAGLIYFLQHSPILERLTLQLCHLPKPFTKMIESYSPRENLFVSKHLKVVEVKSLKVERNHIYEILKLLFTLGVNWEIIYIDEDFPFWNRFSFEQKKYKKSYMS